jgi:chromosome segregation ATPase
MEATDIEKKSLETHVELCAQRYKFLEEKLETFESKVNNLEMVMREIHDMVAAMNAKRNDQLINWGLGLIGGLVATCGWLITTYVLK